MAGIFAAGVAGAADLGRLLPGLEQESLLQRFERRDATPAPNMLVVAVDDKTFADHRLQWPFPRRRHAQAIDRLRRDGARVIVYDVQFTEQTTARDDNALIDAVDRAHNVVLATAETDEHGGTQRARRRRDSCTSIGARGGREQPARGPRWRAAARGVRARRPADAGHRRRTAVGHPPAPRRSRRTAPGSTSTARRGRSTPSRSPIWSTARVDPARVRGRIVVVGAASPTLQDVHPTPTSDTAMSGPEIEANAIDTVMRGKPLRGTPHVGRPADRAGARRSCPRWSACACAPLVAAAVTPAIAFVFLLIAQRAFDARADPAGGDAALRARAGHGDARSPPATSPSAASATASRAATSSSRRPCASGPSSCARRSSRSSIAWPTPPSRATRRPACTSSASAACASASGSSWA